MDETERIDYTFLNYCFKKLWLYQTKIKYEVLKGTIWLFFEYTYTEC